MKLTPRPEVNVKPMWEGGPLGRWSASKTTLTPMRYAKGGFVGSYVCAGCREPCDGVYLVREEQKWLCGPCKSKLQPSGKRHEALNPVQRLGGDSTQDGRP